jgi:hypothetical protein
MDCKTIQTLDASEDGLDGPTSFACGRSFIVVGTHFTKLSKIILTHHDKLRRIHFVISEDSVKIADIHCAKKDLYCFLDA